MIEYCLKSKKVGLKPLMKDHLDRYINWLNDYRLNRHLGPIRGAVFTKEKGQQWYEEMKEGHDKRIFTIFHLPNDIPIGYGGLYNINHRNQRATLQVIIGEKDYQGQGIGTIVTHLLANFGFKVLDLHSISLSVMECNDKALKVPKDLGFQEAGRLRDHWYVDDNYVDKVILDLVRDDFYDLNQSLLDEKF